MYWTFQQSELGTVTDRLPLNVTLAPVAIACWTSVEIVGVDADRPRVSVPEFISTSDSCTLKPKFSSAPVTAMMSSPVPDATFCTVTSNVTVSATDSSKTGVFVIDTLVAEGST